MRKLSASSIILRRGDLTRTRKPKNLRRQVVLTFYVNAQTSRGLYGQTAKPESLQTPNFVYGRRAEGQPKLPLLPFCLAIHSTRQAITELSALA